MKKFILILTILIFPAIVYPFSFHGTHGSWQLGWQYNTPTLQLGSLMNTNPFIGTLMLLADLQQNLIVQQNKQTPWYQTHFPNVHSGFDHPMVRRTMYNLYDR
jgi:hypothetical protein